MADNLTPISGILLEAEIQDALDCEAEHQIVNYNQLINHHNSTVTQFNALNAEVAQNIFDVDTATEGLVDEVQARETGDSSLSDTIDDFQGVLRRLTNAYSVTTLDQEISWSIAAQYGYLLAKVMRFTLPDFDDLDDVSVYDNDPHPLTVINLDAADHCRVFIPHGNSWADGQLSSYFMILAVGHSFTVYPVANESGDPVWAILSGKEYHQLTTG